MKTFSQTDCDIFMEICEGAIKNKTHTMTPNSPEARRKQFWSMRSTLRRNEHINVPFGYASLLADYVPVMDKITLSAQGAQLIATYKE